MFPLELRCHSSFRITDRPAVFPEGNIFPGLREADDAQYRARHFSALHPLFERDALVTLVYKVLIPLVSDAPVVRCQIMQPTA